MEEAACNRVHDIYTISSSASLQAGLISAGVGAAVISARSFKYLVQFGLCLWLNHRKFCVSDTIFAQQHDVQLNHKAREWL